MLDLNLDVKLEIAKLQQQLTGYQWKRKSARKDQKDAEDALEKIRGKKREIEDGLEETLSTLKKRLENLNRRSKFRVQHLEKAKKAVKSTNSSSAMDEVLKAENKAKKKYFDLDDEIDGYDKKIRELEDKIAALKKKLK